VTAGARVADGGAVPVGSAATVLLTMDLKSLTDGIGGATTPTGDVLDAGAARRAACDTDLIPAVLGGPSQPLDVGRRERLVTKGLRAAVVIRDNGCTFPGCDRPPGFCEVHHVTPWWAGGTTSLTNSAMLCCRHHQEVHRHGYTAQVRADGVTWDLTDGRMPGHAHAAA
ncbi:HNH endonuclease signature motif containing protein, partial [Flexivirga meconopsidis]|uniref:HNH endonuclease signature motif containing protein n=1 Tax=Flexivirga meconopsidis TaxID=2977121 RepID=UPI00223F055D